VYTVSTKINQVTSSAIFYTVATLKLKCWQFITEDQSRSKTRQKFLRNWPSRRIFAFSHMKFMIDKRWRRSKCSSLLNKTMLKFHSEVDDHLQPQFNNFKSTAPIYLDQSDLDSKTYFRLHVGLSTVDFKPSRSEPTQIGSSQYVNKIASWTRCVGSVKLKCAQSIIQNNVQC